MASSIFVQLNFTKCNVLGLWIGASSFDVSTYESGFGRNELGYDIGYSYILFTPHLRGLIVRLNSVM